MSVGTVTLTLASAVVAGETVTVGYTVPTDPNASPLEDAAGNLVATFSDREVTNATPASNALPVVSIEVASAGLTVSVAVSEAGSVLSGTPGSTVTFAPGNAQATLGVATDDDSAAEADGRVTATISAGTDYAVSPDAASAGVDVYDNDEATSTAADTLWTSTLTVFDLGGIIVGLYEGLGGDLTPDGWTEDARPFRAEQLYYYSGSSELAFDVSAWPPDSGQLTLHVDALQLRLSEVEGTQLFA